MNTKQSHGNQESDDPPSTQSRKNSHPIQDRFGIPSPFSGRALRSPKRGPPALSIHISTRADHSGDPTNWSGRTGQQITTPQAAESDRLSQVLAVNYCQSFCQSHTQPEIIAL